MSFGCERWWFANVLAMFHVKRRKIGVFLCVKLEFVSLWVRNDKNTVWAGCWCMKYPLSYKILPCDLVNWGENCLFWDQRCGIGDVFVFFRWADGRPKRRGGVTVWKDRKILWEISLCGKIWNNWCKSGLSATIFVISSTFLPIRLHLNDSSSQNIHILKCGFFGLFPNFRDFYGFFEIF